MTTTVVGGMDPTTVKRLTMFIEKIENLEEEKATTAELIKNEFSIAKGEGFDTKAMRQILKIRKADSAEIEELEQILDVYKSALGMQ